VIDAVAHFCTRGNRFGAFDYLRKHFGLGAADSAGALDSDRERQLNTARRRATEQARHSAELERKRQRAWQLWGNAIPIVDTPAELYLRRRAIYPPTDGWPRSMRHSERYPIDRSGPALLFAIQGVGGRFIGLHSIALTKEGRKNPDADGTVKKTWPSLKGGTIRFGRAEGMLFLTEGPEDALSVRQLLGVPVWATVGIGLMRSIDLPSEVDRIVIMADADAAGAAGAERARAAFQDQGLVCSIVLPPSGQDWNGLLQAGLEAAELRQWVDLATEVGALS
jgi:putative DNA primase/helicase